MNTKIIGLLMLVMLFATPALAAITVTWLGPADNLTYNNTPMNAQDVNISFTVTDTNGADIDSHRLQVTLYTETWSVSQTIVDDANVRTLIDSGDNNCFLVAAASTSALSDYQCTVRWDMPENAAMPDGLYHVDVNVTGTFSADGSDGNTLYDTNAFRSLNIDTNITNLVAIRAMLLLISTIVVVGIVIIGVLSIAMLNADPAKTAIGIVAATIAVAIVAMVLGAIIAIM